MKRLIYGQFLTSILLNIMSWKVPEKYRISFESMPIRKGDPFGVFYIPSPDKSRVTKTTLYIIASDGSRGGFDWEHVSLRAVKNIGRGFKNYIPTWGEMCFVKSLFWDDEDVVMQLHPKKSEYINNHSSVLHLWRPKNLEIPTPPSILVGVK